MPSEEYLPPDAEITTEISEAPPSALAILNESEHAAMVTTANLPANRRRIDDFSKKLMAYATHSQPVALSMFYSLPRANKQIVGPSVRFAEIVAPCWKNNSTGSRIIGNTNETVTAQGVFIDYEANLRNVKEIPRKITDKNGQRFNADMILTTSKAALSIAYREAILKGGVPMALWTPAYEQAKLTAVGTAMSHAQRIDAAMEYLTKLKVTEWQILNAVGVSSSKELEIDHLVTLKTLCEEIKHGSKTIEEVFGSEYDKEIDALFTQLQKNETARRLLRNSYMGRAKELVEFLREQAGSAPRTTVREPVKQEEPQDQAQASDQESKQGGKRRVGRPTRAEAAAKRAAEEQEASRVVTEQNPASQPETQETEAESAPAATPESEGKTGTFKFF